MPGNLQKGAKVLKLKSLNSLIFISFLLLIGCPDFEDIQADIFIPNAEKLRIERHLENGDIEFIRANNPAIEKYRCLHKLDLENWVKECSMKCGSE